MLLIACSCRTNRQHQAHLQVVKNSCSLSLILYTVYIARNSSKILAHLFLSELAALQVVTVELSLLPGGHKVTRHGIKLNKTKQNGEMKVKGVARNRKE